MSTNRTYDPDDDDSLLGDGLPQDASRGDDGPARYTLGETLGEGGMGVVRRGLDTRLGREVAIKLLTHQNASAHARFVAEAKVTAALGAPERRPRARHRRG
ncbi:MAG: hypothetical protein IPI35_16455 [Deltaproteobacteria bacterium]|nr:hypothetical protein [Deltaproteobacteria bacterium]